MCKSPRLTDLPFASRFLVWTLRSWAVAEQGDVMAEMRLDGGLRAARVPEAVAPLSRLMTGMGAALRRPLALAPLQAPWVAGDESMLLSAIAAQQRGDRACARTLLACHLPPAAVRIAMREIAELVVLFNRAGLQLGGRRMPQPDPALPHVLPTWCGDAGLQLRH